MSHGKGERQAQFTSMDVGTQEDWTIIADAAKGFNKGLAGRVIEHLKLLDGDFGGFAIDRLSHSVQTATRAWKDGRNEEYTVCALLHDIGDTLGSMNHPDVGAAILKPFVSEADHWMVANHGIFQGYYFFHYIGLDRDLRDNFKGHEYYDHCEEFCRKYDHASFDPDYKSEPLEFFVPMVEKVFSSPKNSVYLKAMEAAE